MAAAAAGFLSAGFLSAGFFAAGFFSPVVGFSAGFFSAAGFLVAAGFFFSVEVEAAGAAFFSPAKNQSHKRRKN